MTNINIYVTYKCDQIELLVLLQDGHVDKGTDSPWISVSYCWINSTIVHSHKLNTYNSASNYTDCMRDAIGWPIWFRIDYCHEKMAGALPWMHMMMALGLAMYRLDNLIISSLVVAAIPVVTVCREWAKFQNTPQITYLMNTWNGIFWPQTHIEGTYVIQSCGIKCSSKFTMYVWVRVPPYKSCMYYRGDESSLSTKLPPNQLPPQQSGFLYHWHTYIHWAGAWTLNAIIRNNAGEKISCLTKNFHSSVFSLSVL